MSLLLDALKKSEAQRRRDASPTIDLTRTPPAAVSTRRGSRWLVGVAAAVLLVAAAPWLWPMLSERLDKPSNGDGKSSVAALESEPAAADAGLQARAASGAVDAKADPAPVAGASSQRPTTAVDMAPQDVSTSVAEHGADSDSGNASTDGERDPGAADSVAATEADIAQSRPSMQEMRRMLQEQHAQRQPPKEQAQDPQQPAQQQQPPRASKPSEAPAERSRPAEEPTRNLFIRPWEMPQVQRAEFPELDLAVHFYAEKPVDRFVLINGERYREGQLVETGVRLVEIRQRGAVVEFSGYRILIE
ncbi:MAG TPA: general secretion pathway protein GspB [Wenzhouxiangellaceae bacterium]|nr:general secretion pathway protein GspB [Wenzhouxiangellaceae bacterium]